MESLRFLSPVLPPLRVRESCLLIFLIRSIRGGRGGRDAEGGGAATVQPLWWGRGWVGDRQTDRETVYIYRSFDGCPDIILLSCQCKVWWRHRGVKVFILML